MAGMAEGHLMLGDHDHFHRLEAENCYCVDRGSCAEIYTLR